MAWLDDRIQTHPKIVALSDRAHRAWINGLCYCSMHGTGGQLGAAIAVHRIPKAIVRELVRAGVWDEEDDGTIWVHDWQAHNESRDNAIDERRAADRERQRAHRERVRTRSRHVTDRDASRDLSRDSHVTPSRDENRDSPRGRAPTRARDHDHDQDQPLGPSSSVHVDDETIGILEALGPGSEQLQRWLHAAGTQPDRFHRCLTAARDRGDNVAAYLDTLIANGSTPQIDEPALDLQGAWARFLNGHGWDETFDEDQVADELERRRRTFPGTLDTHDALAQWHAARAARYPDDDDEPMLRPVTTATQGATVRP